MTPDELSAEGIKVLCRELGPVNAARFIQQLSRGSGNYVDERENAFGSMSVEEIFAEIKDARARNSDRSRSANADTN